MTLIPSYSVLLPCQQYDNGLRATLIGISRQSIQPRSIVIVTDNIECINSLKYDSIISSNHIIIYSSVSSITFQLNLGLNSIQTDFILRCDSGDIPYSKRAELLLENIEMNSSSMSFSRVHLVDPNGKFISLWPLYPNLSKSLQLLPVVNHIIHPSVMIRRDTLISLGGFKSSPRAQDYDLWNEMISSGKLISFVNIPLTTYTSRPYMRSVTANRSVATICGLTIRYKYFLITKNPLYLLTLLLRTFKFFLLGH